ncbi:unnamed protein product [Didymodactylos carnosus]|uniref:Uncharacterized protein n=1 Tax=Didymodactylos carnosus TaxID=1234261 RepID=A0A814XB50_9BILA|nr:unnamed protein product [Didymodactylos carnosus]CAF1213864.1 unnamed protein product [Didymodactylos carnosus]CAF3712326.1 unnamed protein product [Didymodactylos carnosus]CAF3977758.1 unnamed protein product [Didymodactylos carnosus]
MSLVPLAIAKVPTEDRLNLDRYVTQDFIRMFERDQTMMLDDCHYEFPATVATTVSTVQASTMTTASDNDEEDLSIRRTGSKRRKQIKKPLPSKPLRQNCGRYTTYEMRICDQLLKHSIKTACDVTAAGATQKDAFTFFTHFSTTNHFQQLGDEIIMDLWEYMDLFSLWHGWFNLNYRFNQILFDDRLRFTLNLKLFPDDERKHFFKFCILTMPLVSSRLTSLTMTKLYTKKFILLCDQLKFDRLEMLIFDDTHGEGYYAMTEQMLQFIFNVKSLRKLTVSTQTCDDTKSILSRKLICENRLPQLTAFTLHNGYFNLELYYHNLSATNAIKRLSINCEMNDLTGIFHCSKSLKYLRMGLSDGWTYETWKGRGKPALPALPTLREMCVGVQNIPFDDLSNIVRAMPNVERLEIDGILKDRYCYDGEKLKHLFSSIKTVTIKNLEYQTKRSMSTFRFMNDEYWYNVKCEKISERGSLSLSAMGGYCRN